MKIDLTQQYENSDGSPAVIKGKTALDGDVPFTLKDALIQVLLSDADGDRHPIPASEKIKRYDLYRTINKSRVGFVLLSAEEVAFLQKAALVLPTISAGQTYAMLDTPFVEPAKEQTMLTAESVGL